MEKKSNRGGARPGAGRPAIYSKRVQIRLTPQELSEANKKAERRAYNVMQDSRCGVFEKKLKKSLFFY